MVDDATETRVRHLRDNPDLKTSDPEFPQLSLEQVKQVALSLIRTNQYKDERIQAFTMNNRILNPIAKLEDYPVIIAYLEAMINLDRRPVEAWNGNVRADTVQRAFINEVIDNRNGLHAFYLEFKRDLIEATRIRTRLSSSASIFLTPGGRESLSDKIRRRDGYRCLITGVYDSTYWDRRENRDRDDHPSKLHSIWLKLEVAHIIPWNPENNYWGLVQRLTGLVIDERPDVPQNALLVHLYVHQFLREFRIYFDDQVLDSLPNARQSPVSFGGLVELPILRPESCDVAAPAYKFFLLHRLVGDVVHMAGGIGLEDLDTEDDYGPEMDEVSERTLVTLMRKLENMENP